MDSESNRKPEKTSLSIIEVYYKRLLDWQFENRNNQNIARIAIKNKIHHEDPCYLEDDSSIPEKNKLESFEVIVKIAKRDSILEVYECFRSGESSEDFCKRLTHFKNEVDYVIRYRN